MVDRTQSGDVSGSTGCSQPVCAAQETFGRVERPQRAFLCIIIFLYGPFAFAQNPEVIVEVDRQQVYLGESITYNVTLNHVENPSKPDLTQLEGFDVSFNGQQSLNSSSITIINGRRSEVIRRGMLYQYRLTPTTPGPQTIPAPSVVIDGETLTGKPIQIGVIAPEEQDLVLLETTTDRESVYPLQPFTISLTVAVKQLPGELADRSPLSVQGRDPAKLSIPWLEDEQIPEGLQPKGSWRDILEPMVSGSSRRGSDGFQINGIGSSSAFSLFERSRKAVFLPKANRTTRKDADGADAGYFEYRFQRTFVPHRVGEYRFAASNVKGMFGTKLNGASLDGQDVYAVSKSITVKVNDVPLEGRPDSYIGAIGTFDVASDITPRSAAVGDPVTLSMTIHGEGTIADIRAPDIESLEGLDQQFRIYESTQETIGNGKVFRWSLRPLDEAVTEFPAIPVGFFNVQKGEYEVVSADPIPLTITAAKELAAADIMTTPGAVANQPLDDVQLNDAGLFANYSGLNTLRSDRASLAAWLPVWGAMVIGYVGLSLGLKRRQHLQSDPRIMRRRSATSRANESLRTVITAAGSEDAVSPDLLSKIIGGLIADFTGTDEAGITATDAKQLLANANSDSALTERVPDFFDRCDAARYGGGRGDASLTAECRELISDVSRELNQ